MAPVALKVPLGALGNGLHGLKVVLKRSGEPCSPGDFAAPVTTLWVPEKFKGLPKSTITPHGGLSWLALQPLLWSVERVVRLTLYTRLIDHLRHGPAESEAG